MWLCVLGLVNVNDTIILLIFVMTVYSAVFNARRSRMVYTGPTWTTTLDTNGSNHAGFYTNPL